MNKTAPTVEAETPYRMIRTTNVRDGKLRLAGARYVDAETYQTWTRRAKLQRGDVILTREAPVGEVAMVDEQENLFLGQRLMQYRADPRVLDSKFLLYSFLSDKLQNQFTFHGDVGSTVSHIRVGDCQNFVLGVPPLEEQRKIADILSTWDEAIEQQERLLELKRERKRGLMQQLLTGKVRFKEFKGLEWSEGQISDFLELQRGYDLPIGQRSYGDVPIIASNGLTGYHNEPRVKGLGVITGRSGTIGKVIFETSDFWPLNTSLYVKNFKGNDPRFVFYFLTNLQLERFSNGTSVPTLNRNDVHPVETRFPLISEQQEIAAVLSAADTELETLETQLSVLCTQKRGLMQRLLTGKTRVRVDAAPVGAAVLP